MKKNEKMQAVRLTTAVAVTNINNYIFFIITNLQQTIIDHQFINVEVPPVSQRLSRGLLLYSI